jgi:hypothetical protein
MTLDFELDCLTMLCTITNTHANMMVKKWRILYNRLVLDLNKYNSNNNTHIQKSCADFLRYLKREINSAEKMRATSERVGLTKKMKPGKKRMSFRAALKIYDLIGILRESSSDITPIKALLSKEGELDNFLCQKEFAYRGTSNEQLKALQFWRFFNYAQKITGCKYLISNETDFSLDVETPSLIELWKFVERAGGHDWHMTDYLKEKKMNSAQLRELLGLSYPSDSDPKLYDYEENLKRRIAYECTPIMKKKLNKGHSDLVLSYQRGLAHHMTSVAFKQIEENKNLTSK